MRPEDVIALRQEIAALAGRVEKLEAEREGKAAAAKAKGKAARKAKAPDVDAQ